MRRLALKVHRAATPGEVATLADLCVDYVGFDVDISAFYGLDKDPLWRDERHLLEEMLPDVLAPLRKSRAVVELAPDSLEPAVPGRLAELGVRLLQVPLHPPPDAPLVEASVDAGLTLVYDRTYVESSSPLDFVDFVDPDRPALAFYEVDLFSTSRDPVAALLRPLSGALGLAELDILATQAPLFVSVGATPDTIVNVATALATTHVAGLAFTLSDTSIGTYHSYRFDDVVRMVRLLRRASG